MLGEFCEQIGLLSPVGEDRSESLLDSGPPCLVEAVVPGRLELLELGEEVGLAALKSRDLPGERGRAFVDIVADRGSVYRRGQEAGARFAEDPSLEELADQRL